MTTYLEDSFAGALDVTIEGHAPDVISGGGVWPVQGTNPLRHTGDGYLYKAAFANPYIFSVAMPVTDYDIEVVIKSKTILAVDFVILYGRSVDATNNYNLVIDKTGLLTLSRNVGGTNTPITTNTQTAFATNTVRTVVLRMVGSNIKVLWDGATVIDVTDTQYAGPGKPGFRIGGSSSTVQTASTGMQVDNIRVMDPPVTTPVNTLAPAITTDGTPQTGETITVSNGTWTGVPSSFTYQWKRNGTNIAGQTASSYTLVQADESQSIKCTVTAVNGSGSTPADSNTITGQAASQVVTTDVVRRLSGGASNSDPLVSYGGVESSVVINPLTLFDTIPNSAATPGQTDYRCFYVHNANPFYSVTAIIYVPTQPPDTHHHVAVGVATEAAGTTVAAVANRLTLPPGVSFSSPSTVGAGLSLGTIAPGQGKGVWVRWIADVSTPPSSTNPVQLALQITQI